MKKWLGVWLIIFVVLAQGCGKSQPPAKKYNVMVIAVDTLRADHLGCYGYSFPTSPRLDALAKKSLFFEHAFCPIPKTSASFASLLTGLHPCIHETKPNRGMLDDKYLTLAEMLQSHGYRTAAVVDNANLAKIFRFDQGFEAYSEVWNEVEDKSQSTPFITEKVISFLNAPQEKPFFLWVNYIEPHAPYWPPQRFIAERPAGRDVRQVENRIVPRRIMDEMKQNDQFNEGYYIARYDGAVRYVDEEVGRILDVFFRKGLDKNTIFIFVADHGEDLGERNYFFEHGPLTFTASVRIPLMVLIPGQKPARVRTPVSIMDIYPTVLAQLRIQPPYELQGVDLLAPEKDRLLYILGIGTEAVVKNGSHFISVNSRIAKKLKIEPKHFYDFFADPRESDNLYGSRTREAAALFAKYDAYLNQHDYFKALHENRGKRKLTDKERKSLKTLGYL